jgi:formylglycine-generating enzyme required for sulfatase activity
VRAVDGRATQYTAADGLPATEVVSVFTTPYQEEGLIWVATASGLARFIAPIAPAAQVEQSSIIAEPYPAFTLDQYGVTWVQVEGGYLRSTPSSPPSEAAWVEDFEVSRTEITRGQWALLTGTIPPAEAALPQLNADGLSTLSEVESLPAISDLNSSTWGLSLPTHEEWALLTQSGRLENASLYPWPEAQPWDEGPSCDRANQLSCGGALREPCLSPLGQSAHGLCDLSGNASEWVVADEMMSLGGGAFSSSFELRVTSRVLESDPQASTRAPEAARGFRLIRRAQLD